MEKTFGFFFIFSLLEPIALGKKKTKKEKKQNNTIRMLLDLVFFFRFPPEIHPLRRGGESWVPQDTARNKQRKYSLLKGGLL